MLLGWIRKDLAQSQRNHPGAEDLMMKQMWLHRWTIIYHHVITTINPLNS